MICCTVRIHEPKPDLAQILREQVRPYPVVNEHGAFFQSLPKVGDQRLLCVQPHIGVLRARASHLTRARFVLHVDCEFRRRVDEQLGIDRLNPHRGGVFGHVGDVQTAHHARQRRYIFAESMQHGLRASVDTPPTFVAKSVTAVIVGHKHFFCEGLKKSIPCPRPTQTSCDENALCP